MKYLKNTLLFIGQIILIAFLGFLARECWRIYHEEQQAARVNKDGIRVLVRLNKVSTEKKNWRDYIGNSRYITFHHQGKAYTLRYIQDTIFLQDGATVPVTYSPAEDEFIQPGKGFRRKEVYKTSPLVRWTVVSLFSGANTALFGFIVLTAIILVFITGMLANLTGIGLIRKLGDSLILICALGGAIYLSYDAISYWRYYSSLKHQGAPQTAQVEDIERKREFNNDQSRVVIFYVYEARINFHGESRVIAAGEKDYDHTKPGDQLNVLYDQGKDDLMSANYSLQYDILIFPLIIWAFALFFYLRRMKGTRTA